MVDKEKIEQAVRLLLEGIGEDPEREGLKETPDRIARMYEEIYGGMDESPREHLHKTFTAEKNEMVLEKDITFYSTCEHHLMPFYGKVHVAYIPDGRVVGISKLARTVDIYARRLQIQEQMTAQIADALMEYLAPKGVMVMAEAEHMCMTMRGIKKPGTTTVTVVTKGAFEHNEALQNTFFHLLGSHMNAGIPDSYREDGNGSSNGSPVL
ncbi:MAG: GTP cyclohydrolase I FolE [bacterium]|nr:GTP cyclohydrolase I FolE [bacterium]